MYLDERYEPAGPLLFKRGDSAGFTEAVPVELDGTVAGRTRAYVCRFCGHVITFPEMMIRVDGSSRHVFTNPAGIVYEIACFSSASGCAVAGEPTMEFSWFPGFHWRYAVCSGCRNHMGWQYLHDESTFYGLVTRYLAENQ